MGEDAGSALVDASGLDVRESADGRVAIDATVDRDGALLDVRRSDARVEAPDAFARIDVSRPDAPTPPDGALVCIGTLLPCNGVCVNPQTDVMHCGGCGMVCAIPSGFSAVAECVSGVCRARCDMGRGNCDRNLANGCETDVNSSPMHCGMCGRMCPPMVRCMGGMCQP